MQLFIAHNRGCQYYIGRLDDKRFRPRLHGRMIWVDDSYFAPEAYIDGQGRQVAFAWLRDNLPNDYERFGWSGVMALPRILWRREDGTLGIAPAPEVDQLAYNECILAGTAMDDLTALPVEVPHSCRFQWQADAAGITGLRIQSGEHHVEILCDPVNGELAVDATHSGSEIRSVRESAPLTFDAGEKAQVTVYIDHSVIEVFANDRQAITRRVYMPLETVEYHSIGACYMECMTVSAMAPSQPY